MSYEEFNHEDTEVLAELLNIGFGNGAAEVSDLIDKMVLMRVPEIKLIEADSLSTLLDELLPDKSQSKVCTQSFVGEMSGTALVILSGESPRDFLNEIIGGEGEEEEVSSSFLQLTNLLNSSCVSQIADLLTTRVSFNSPQIAYWEDKMMSELDYNSEEGCQVVMCSRFQLEGNDVEGLYVIQLSKGSNPWLKKSLQEFLDELG